MASAILEFSTPRRVPTAPSVTDWLDSQARVVDIWIDRLVAEGGDVSLIAVLDQHAAFLREALERSTDRI
ncbi:MAG: hypothetical protein CMH90_01110 [Oceanicaulis sp.]|uniref:hypothetical protein n=1 Tax=Oceanicaulis sp. UBA2681 TaxID=1947007 RepID=UPI000C0B3199|nr:hypothetical protein [Oceanicaulis sp. UBA2681]MAP48059.1 hypothetical protein [Oceanicaulis sp.]HCR65241.1 hypothetical protein [Oceanicaulis sp.]|tara:strand:+ start:1075 stop:1284 length:210 start_codon:yes stop_codon:yes gene_type:complete